MSSYAPQYDFSTTITFGTPTLPSCADCGVPTTWQLPDSRIPACRRCGGIRFAESWLAVIFESVGPDLHSRLYRSLSTIFHPDAGGDERLMKALNAVKERFP